MSRSLLAPRHRWSERVAASLWVPCGWARTQTGFQPEQRRGQCSVGGSRPPGHRPSRPFSAPCPPPRNSPVRGACARDPGHPSVSSTRPVFLLSGLANTRGAFRVLRLPRVPLTSFSALENAKRRGSSEGSARPLCPAPGFDSCQPCASPSRPLPAPSPAGRLEACL